MEENKVENVINIIKDMDIKDKLRLGICLTTSDWVNILYNKTEMYEKFDTMLKDIDEEYRTTLINFARYKLVMFTLAKIMEMQEIDKNNKAFEDIKHVDENGVEFWYARELMPILQYSNWQNFEKIIHKAMIACENSNIRVIDHFTDVNKMVQIGSGAYREQIDYKLTRYACYSIAQNGDSRKKVIALAQTYFAVQTRKQEITEKEYSMLTEEEKRFYQRNLTRKGNYSLNQTAKKAGVKNFDRFHNSGYKGLHNGETADDIAKRKGLRYREDILDNMGSDELIANLFRISQTEQKLRKDNIQTEKEANKAHYEVGSKIRKTIKEFGGTMPEDLPTPKKSLKQLEKEKNKKLRDKN